MLTGGRDSCRSRHNGAMSRVVKWLLAGVLLLVLLPAAVALALQQWVGSADFRARVAQQAGARLRVPVEIGQVTVAVWPVPAVALDQVQVKSRPAITIGRLEARPLWTALVQGRLEIATLVVREARLPEQAVTALVAALANQREAPPRPAASAASSSASAPLPRRILLEQVTWLPAKGAGSTVDAELHTDPDGLAGHARFQVRQGRFQGARATLQRNAEQWTLNAEIGGGTVKGRFERRSGGKAASTLQGEIDTANVEVAALTAPTRTLTGRVDAHTTMRAELGGAGSLADSVRSQTRFTVREAVVHGLDLMQAVKSVGLSRGGETRLDTLAGQVVTQGRAVQLNNLVASSGLLSATGNVAMTPAKALSGRISVQVAAAAAGGAIGVPLAVGGTLDAPSVTLTQGALLGAAVGTILAPGVGTGAGAAAGDQLGEKLRGLFGR
jgi:hypothetical protein